MRFLPWPDGSLSSEYRSRKLDILSLRNSLKECGDSLKKQGRFRLFVSFVIGGNLDMSLTVLIHKDAPVVIVRWFLNPEGNLIFASGPVVQMDSEQFRANGYHWVLRHFDEYSRLRVPENKIVPVFAPGEAERLMKNRRSLEIGRYPDGTLIFSPKVIRRYDLADLGPVPKEHRRTIPENSPTDVFWKAFDQALAAAPLDE